MNKIQFKKLKETLYKEEQEIFIDSQKDFAEDERTQALSEFENYWKDVQDVEGLVDILCELGFKKEEALERIVELS